MKKLIIVAGLFVAGIGTVLAVNNKTNNCCTTSCCDTNVKNCCVVKADCCETSDSCCND